MKNDSPRAELLRQAKLLICDDATMFYLFIYFYEVDPLMCDIMEKMDLTISTNDLAK